MGLVGRYLATPCETLAVKRPYGWLPGAFSLCGEDETGRCMQ